MAKKMKQNQSQYSSYWFDDADYDVQSYRGIASVDGETDKEANRAERMVELLKLGAFMRSAKNFVGILTGRDDINVQYKDGDDSYTDGNSVVLSAKVEGNFDSTIGLALHEASHIKLTNFKALHQLFTDHAFRSQFISKEQIKKVVALNPKLDKWAWTSMFDYNTMPKFADNTSELDKAAEVYLLLQLKSYLNWVEDRRIDNFVYTTAPGYRGYYEALYNRYFYSDEVTDALKKDKTFNTETFDSYEYRIINLLNSANNLDSLKGLRSIKQTVDVTNIGRLSTTEDALKVASSILETVTNNVTSFSDVNEKKKQYKLGDKGQGGADGMTINLDDLTDEQIKDMFGMSRKQLKKLLDKLNDQKKFNAGDVDKKKLSKADAQQMNAMQDSGVTLETAGGDEFNNQKVRVFVIERINEAIIDGGEFPNAFIGMEYPDRSMENAVSRGIVMGKQLGSKLQVRNEERILKHTRQDAGKIDRRLVHSLGYDVANVFSKLDVARYNKAHIHISVDASGSMGGNKMTNATQMAVSIAVACKMTQNIECVISYRTTQGDMPVVFVAYDSRKNGIAHIKKYFPHIQAAGATPESLCFEAMMNKVFPKMQSGENFFFVNLSDGEPAFSSGRNRSDAFYYSGHSAYAHCKRMVNRMQKEHGASILSYFIGYNDEVSENFKEMYGAMNTFAVSPNSVFEIARVMNKKFMEHHATNTNDGGAI